MQWIGILFLINLSFINCYGELNQTEVDLCYNKTQPTSHSDCLEISETFRSVVCCFYEMTEPETGNTCVPIEQNSKGLRGNVNSILPPKVTIKGYYTCGINYLKNVYFMILMTIYVYI